MLIVAWHCGYSALRRMPTELFKGVPHYERSQRPLEFEIEGGEVTVAQGIVEAGNGRRLFPDKDDPFFVIGKPTAGQGLADSILPFDGLIFVVNCRASACLHELEENAAKNLEWVGGGIRVRAL